MGRDYLTRLVDPLLDELLPQLPAILLVGPRASGKTTTGRRHAATVLRLDRPAEADAVRADPDATLRGLEEPILLDEWQVVPAVLGAVKRAVDDDPRPGRFLLTGSVRADLDAQTWPGTGRVVRLAVVGLTMRELTGHATHRRSYFDRLADDGIEGLTAPTRAPDLRDYVALALRSGFPEPALHLADAVADRWLESYVDQVVTRDAQQVGAGRDPDRLRRYFEALCLNSAGVVDDKTLWEAVGIDRKTALAYEGLLQAIYLLDRMPAWTSNRLKRLVRQPKRYLVDPALMAAGLRVGVNGVMRDGHRIGRLLDTFVAAQLRAEVPVSRTRPRLFHLRRYDGRREVDLIAELDAHRVVAIEVKADAAPGRDSAKHLVWLRDELQDRFVCGVVLHCGPRVFQIDDRIAAAPIASLWT